MGQALAVAAQYGKPDVIEKAVMLLGSDNGCARESARSVLKRYTSETATTDDQWLHGLKRTLTRSLLILKPVSLELCLHRRRHLRVRLNKRQTPGKIHRLRMPCALLSRPDGANDGRFPAPLQGLFFECALTGGYHHRLISIGPPGLKVAGRHELSLGRQWRCRDTGYFFITDRASHRLPSGSADWRRPRSGRGGPGDCRWHVLPKRL